MIWAAIGVVIERGEGHRRVFDLLRAAPADGSAVTWDDRDFYPDAAPCLARLRNAGLFVGVAGNVGWDLAPFLAEAGIEVDYVATSFTLGVEKPSPEFFARLVKAAGVEPAEIAYVGDRVDNDVRPALAAGMFAVHIRRGPWGYLQDGARDADVCIESLDELPKALEHA